MRVTGNGYIFHFEIKRFLDRIRNEIGKREELEIRSQEKGVSIHRTRKYSKSKNKKTKTPKSLEMQNGDYTSEMPLRHLNVK